MPLDKMSNSGHIRKYQNVPSKRKSHTMKTFNEIAAEYAPYHTMQAFQLGAQDYMDRAPLRDFPDVDGQAYDRGAEAAMRYTRQKGGINN
jgi:hypothetical protein